MIVAKVAKNNKLLMYGEAKKEAAQTKNKQQTAQKGEPQKHSALVGFFKSLIGGAGKAVKSFITSPWEFHLKGETIARVRTPEGKYKFVYYKGEKETPTATPVTTLPRVAEQQMPVSGSSLKTLLPFIAIGSGLLIVLLLLMRRR